MTNSRSAGWLPLVFAVLVAFVVATAGAADWPQFLGPERNGVSAETGLLSQWPNDGPNVVWRTPLGVGMSGVAIAGGRAFTMLQNDSDQFVVALSADDGRVLWRTPVASAYSNAMGDGPRSTPTVAGRELFVYTGEGVLVACDADSGKKLWSVDVPKSLSTPPSEYGMSCSPVVTGDLVIVFAGAETATVAAFHRADGKPAWKSGSGRAGYSSPVLMTLAGRPQIVALTGSGVQGLEPVNGKAFWSFPFPTEYDCNTACPVQIDGESILISAGENHGTAIVRIAADGPALRAEEVWNSLGKDSQLRAEWQTPVIHDGHVYGLDNIGGAGPITNLVCIRLSDHKTMWMKPRFGKSNLILADGKLFLTTMKGELVIVEATPAEFRELSRATLTESTRQAPSLSNGRLFVRDNSELLCIDLKAR